MGVAIALSAVVHKYGEVLAARGEDGAALRDASGQALRDGPSGLLRVNGGCVLRDGATPPRRLRASGILLWHMLRTTASLRQTGIRRSEGTEPQQEGV